MNPLLMAGLLRHLGRAVRDEDMLEVAGVTAGEALFEVESLLLEGLRLPSGRFATISRQRLSSAGPAAGAPSTPQAEVVDCAPYDALAA